jgi:hypothetical protein
MKDYLARIARARTSNGLNRIVRRAWRDPALSNHDRLRIQIEAALRNL